jgi:TorA maturation chaperone TorD
MAENTTKQAEQADVASQVALALQSQEAMLQMLAALYYAPLTEEQLESLAAADLAMPAAAPDLAMPAAAAGRAASLKAPLEQDSAPALADVAAHESAAAPDPSGRAASLKAPLEQGSAPAPSGRAASPRPPLEQGNPPSPAECPAHVPAPAEAKLASGLGLMDRYLKQRHSAARLELNVDFTGAFYGMREFDGKVATPYESVFRSESGLLNQQPRNEVFSAYRQHGLKLEDRFSTPEDHLSFELQFISYLASKAADALAAGDCSAASSLVHEASSFLAAHVLSWFKAFQSQALLLVETDFYRGVIMATEGYLDLLATALAEAESDLAAYCK